MAQSFEEALPGLQAAGYENIMEALAAYNAANAEAYFAANPPAPSLSAPLSMPIFGPPAPSGPEPSRLEQVATFIQNNIDNPQAIADAAKQFNVSAQEIQQAIGVSPQDQAAYFSQANVTPAYQGLDLTPVSMVTGQPGQTPTTQQDLLLETQTTPATFLPLSSGSSPVSPLDYGKMVSTAYSNVLNRQADPSGLNWWVSQLESGKISPQEFEAAFRDVAQPELDVKQLYQDVLKREADISGLAHWTKEIGAGGITPEERERFVQEAIKSGEIKAPAAPTTTTTTTTAAPTPTIDYNNRQYDRLTLLNLAGQISPNITAFSGGVFSENRPSVGFDYDTAKGILGKDPSVGQQVVLDMAKSLMDRGITDINQIQTRDVFSDAVVYPRYDGRGNITGYYRLVQKDEFSAPEEVNLRPEELSKVEHIPDPSGESYGYHMARGVATGKELFAGDTVLTQTAPGMQDLDFVFGQTFSGPGRTNYNVYVDPTTGKTHFSVFGGETGDASAIRGALSVLQFVPGAQPFVMAANAYMAYKNGDTLGTLAALSGMTDYSNVSTALRVASSIEKGDINAAVTAIMANPSIANAAGTTMLTDSISLKDASAGISIVNSLANNDVSGVLINAGKLVDSPDIRLAGEAVKLINAAQSGNINAMFATVKAIDAITTDATTNLNNKDTVGTLVNNITQSEISKTGKDTLSEAVYVSAINSGATEDEALDAANTITSITKVEGGDTTKVSTTGDVKTDLLSGVTKVDMGEFEGLDDAVKRTTELNTLNISNTQADTLEEAAALAANRGFNNFTFGGDSYSVSNSSVDLAKNITNAEIASATTFSDAYSTARSTLGPGQTFEWNGKQYSTDTREENTSLAAASDQIRLAERGLGGGKGTYAGYDEKATADNLSKIDFTGLDQAQTYGTFDPYLKSAGLGGEYVIVDDKISKQIIQPVVTTVGLVTRGVGGIADWTAGALQSIEVIDKDSGLIKIAKDLKDLSAHQIGDYVLNQEKEFINRIDQAQGADKITALIDGFKTNPIAVITLSTSELVEEAPSFVAGVLSLVAKAPKIFAYGSSAITNMIEAAGAGYNDTKAQALASGKSEQEAHQLAQTSSAAQGALGLVLGSVVELPLIKRAGELIEGGAKTGVKESATQVGKTVTKEVGTESIEAGGAAALSSYFGTGQVNMNQVLTSAILDPVIAGNVSGTVATAVEVAGSKPATTEVIAAATSNPEQATNLINTINSTMQPGVDLKQAGADIVTAMTASGMNTQQANSVANTAIAEQVITNINAHGQLNIPDLNIAVGADKFGNAVTLGDFIGSSVTGTGDIAYVAPDVYIGTGANGKTLTVGDLSSLSSFPGGTTTTGTTTDQSGATTTSSVNTNTGATTETTTNPNTGVNTSTVTDQNTGVTTQLTTDPNTNTNSEVKTDTKNNTETTTTTDSNTNTTTQTVVDNNTNTTTTINTNSNSQVVSEVKVDNNTNTQTTTNTNVDNNTQTTTTVDLNTNRVISEETTPVTTIKTVNPVPEVEETKQSEEEKKKKEKEKKRRRLTQGMPGGMGMAGGITGLEPQMLESFVTGEKKIDPLERLREIQQESEAEAMIQNIDPRLASVLQDRLGIRPQQEDLSGLGTLARVLSGQSFDPVQAKKAKEGDYYSYGKEDSIDDILGTTQMQGLPYAAGGYVEPLMAQGGMTLPLMAKKGGLPSMAEGREDFRDGKHVAGEGDGQSDDIPAMLADGEFVFPADVVSALGNGSSKAGTDKLYEMMHAIRERARSTGKKDLPPPALKSPLDYLKSKR